MEMLVASGKWGVRYYAPDQYDADEMGAVIDYVDGGRAAAERLAEDIIAPNYGPELVIVAPRKADR